MTLQELEMLKTHLDAICRGHRVATFYLFGSQAEGHDDGFSNVDIGVVFFEPPNDTDWWEQLQRLAVVVDFLNSHRVCGNFRSVIPQW
jgi:predicted nucleotidyltransferase